MKKALMFSLIVFFFLVGCNTPGQGGTEQPVINQLAVSEVNDSIEILYSDLENIKFSKVEVQEEIQRIRTLYDQLNDDEKKLVTNYENFLEIEALYKEYLEQKALEEAEKQKIINAVAKAAEYAKECIPLSNTGEDIELPNSYESEDGVDVYIGWTTADPFTITNKGKVTQPRNASRRVKLTAVCRSGDISETVEKTVTVGPLKYEALPEKPVFAYYYTNQRSLTEVERETIDVINLSFGGIDVSNGQVYVTGLNTETVLQERKYGIRVTFSVQQKDGFKTWTTTAEKREVLAQSFVDVVEQYHFDGVDIDWEYPDGGEVKNYVEFVKLLYNKLKAKSRNYLVTSAMYGGNGVSKYDAGTSHKYLDYIHLMTYDLNSADVAQHLTALSKSSNGYSSVKQTVEFYLAAGVPKEKLVIGAAFYGKVYELSTTGTSFIGERPLSSSKDHLYSILYSSIRANYLPKIGQNLADIKVEKRWDSVAEAPYLCITEYKNGIVSARKFITYDDQQSIKLKVEYLLEADLGGIMFWELGYEDRDTDDLVIAIRDTIKK